MWIKQKSGSALFKMHSRKKISFSNTPGQVIQFFDCFFNHKKLIQGLLKIGQRIYYIFDRIV